MASIAATLCRPCSRMEENVEASYYCYDCFEHICPRCRSFHLKFKPTIQHKVVELDELSESTAKHPFLPGIGKCQLHPGRPVKFYCKKQDAICCQRCVNESHRKCQVVSLEEHVKTLQGDVEKVKEAVSGELTDLGSEVSSITSQYEESLAALQVSTEAVPTKLSELKEQFSNALVGIEQKVNKELTQGYQKEKSTLSEHLERSKTVLSRTEDMQSLLATTGGNGEKTKLFLTCHALKKEIAAQRRVVQEVHSSLPSSVTVDVCVEPGVQQLIEKLGQAVHVTTTVIKNETPPPQLHKPYRNRHAQLRDQVNVTSPEDQKSPRITGAAFLDNGKLVLADEANRAIKLFDSSYVYVSKKTFPRSPGSVAVTQSNDVAVTLRADSRIYILSISNMLIIEKCVLNCGVDCYGIANKDDEELLVSFNSGPGVLVVSKDGNHTHRIATNKAANKHLRYPFGLVYQRSTDTAYVSSASLCCVTGLDMRGQVKFTYSAPSLKWCLGLALDPDGNVYICGHSSGNIHQITPLGTFVKVLLSENDGIKHPVHMSFCPDGESFLLSDDADKSYIKIFKLV